ncbi:MAG: MFS transporter [Alphaproteobacteria bacterium]|nr:MFS transporter [Alphaproteobacteria bacterium]
MADRKAIVSWCLYDWANSAYPTVVTTFVFGAYFTKAVAVSPEAGTAAWGYAVGAAGFAVALLGPVLGAIADQGGRRKPWLAVFTVSAALTTALLWFTRPDPHDAMWALVFVALSSVAFEFGMVFYNAMLPDLVGPDRVGRVSGWGWGLGYAGGLVCLVIALFGFVQTETPLFGVSTEAAGHVRAVTLLAAAWFALFALPLFLFTPDRPAVRLGVLRAIGEGIAALRETLREIRNYAAILRFLVARMFYADGLVTLFAVGGIYAAGTFGMTFGEVVQFGIALNVTAGIGAFAFAWADDRIGAKPVIVIALVALIALGGAALLVTSKTAFWAVGMGLGVFVGPAQAASRSMMARLAPPVMRTEMFGLYALSGKATAFMGPLAFGFTTDLFDSQRAGMATILVFLAVGLVLLLPVREPHH